MSFLSRTLPAAELNAELMNVKTFLIPSLSAVYYTVSGTAPPTEPINESHLRTCLNQHTILLGTCSRWRVRRWGPGVVVAARNMYEHHERAS